MKEVYPIDVDRAFKALDRIKDKIHIWFKNPAEIPPVLASGEIVMSPGTASRFLTLNKTEDAPLAVNWNQGILQTDCLAIPKGSKKRANATRLISFMNQPEVQARLAEAAFVGPANVKALDPLSDSLKRELPTYHTQAGEMLVLNAEWWGENLAKMEEKWNEWKLT